MSWNGIVLLLLLFICEERDIINYNSFHFFVPRFASYHLSHVDLVCTLCNDCTLNLRFYHRHDVQNGLAAQLDFSPVDTGNSCHESKA
jgi:hypothetical protein